MGSSDTSHAGISFKDRLEQHPLVVVFAIVLTTVLITAAAVNWFNGDYTKSKYEAELSKNEAEFATAKGQYESRIRDLEDRIRDMEADFRKGKTEIKQSGSTASPTPVPKSDSPPVVGASNRPNVDRASAFISKARSLYDKKQFQAAINECDKALRIDPKNETARQLRAEIQNTMKILNPQ